MKRRRSFCTQRKMLEKGCPTSSSIFATNRTIVGEIVQFAEASSFLVLREDGIPMKGGVGRIRCSGRRH